MPAEPFKYDGTLDEWKKGQIMRFCRSSALDIGCNTGALVGYLTSIGRHAEGIDNSEQHIEEARRTFPSATFHLGTDLTQFTDGQFDSVVAWNVLEHIPEDEEALRQFLRIARENVIISVPKEDDLSLPYSRVTYRPYVDPTHLHYYTRESVSAMVKRIGEYSVFFEDTTPVRPMLAYAKIGIPLWLCRTLDALFWKIGRGTEILHANLMVIITKTTDRTHS
jgi:ubiquinone/menaquinone biosynthesis C-methylase UbiE